jgi:hypothetical protein
MWSSAPSRGNNRARRHRRFSFSDFGAKIELGRSERTIDAAAGATLRLLADVADFPGIFPVFAAETASR